MIKSKGIGGWKSDEPIRTDIGSSIRGKTISSPIPFPDDDEFPFRSHRHTISPASGPEDDEKKMQLESSAPIESQGISHDDEKDAFPDSKSIESFEAMPPQPSYTPPQPPTTEPAHVRLSTPARLSNVAVERPKKKKSSLRAVFGKLFGKKSRNSLPPKQPDEGTGNVRAGQHRSVSEQIPAPLIIADENKDPMPLKSISNNDKPSPQRSVSLPINELDRALRSHSAAADDYRFPLTPNLNRGSILQGDGKTSDEQEKPRRATLSGVWSAGKAPGYTDWTGLTPRPASSHARGSKVNSDDGMEGPVGIALTSGSYPKRRSRSAGELRALTTSGLSMRDRNDEGRYWVEGERPALLPLTPTIIEPGQPAADPLTPSTVEGRSPAVAFPLTPSIKGVGEPISPDEEEAAHGQVPEMPRPFNFGPVIEIDESRPTQSNTLQERIQKLESRMDEIENIVFRSGGHTLAGRPFDRDVGFKGLERERSPSSTRPRTANSELSISKQQKFRDMQQPRISEGLTSQDSVKPPFYDSRRPSTISTNTSYQPSSDNQPFPQSLTSSEQKLMTTHHTLRPLSNSTTIRGYPSTPPTIPNDSTKTEESYTSLLNMILAERAARLELESLVLKLQQRLQTMAWTSYSGAGSDPTKPRREGMVAGQFLDLEQDDSSFDDGQYTNEEFRTPNEETGLFGDEIFGGVAHNKTTSKSAPRVVSLSQMTLGRNAQPGLGF